MGIKIGIVEDELIIARTLFHTISDLGYEPIWIAINYIEAKIRIEEEKPDLIFLDIKLNGGQLDGIDLGILIHQRFKIPFIYLTANTDIATIDRAKNSYPIAFLSKPITKNSIYSSIEISLKNYLLQNASIESDKNLNLANNTIFLKDGSINRRIIKTDIAYIKSDNVYIHVFFSSESKYITLRRTMDNFMEELNFDKLIRIHRRYVVNIEKIIKFDKNTIWINKEELPLSKNFRDKVLQKINQN